MTTISIPVEDLVLDPEGNPNLAGLSADDLGAVLRPYYTFLGSDVKFTVANDTVTITTPDITAYQEDHARRAYVP